MTLPTILFIIGILLLADSLLGMFFSKSISKMLYKKLTQKEIKRLVKCEFVVSIIILLISWNI